MAAGDLVAQTVRITGQHGDEIPAYLARPDGEGPFPIVVVLHHRDGWDRESKEIALRFAAEGYATLLPHLHHRWAPGQSPAVAAERSLADGGVSNDQVVEDTRGALEYLRAQPYTSGRAGVIGYCSGGRQSFYVSTELDFDATVMCYGPKLIAAPEDLTAVTPISPITRADRLSAPVLGLYGAEDRNPSPEMTAAVSAELDRLGKEHRFVTYQNAGHAFFAVDRASYRYQAATEGWAEVLAWFGRLLREPAE